MGQSQGTWCGPLHFPSSLERESPALSLLLRLLASSSCSCAVSEIVVELVSSSCFLSGIDALCQRVIVEDYQYVPTCNPLDYRTPSNESVERFDYAGHSCRLCTRVLFLFRRVRCLCTQPSQGWSL